MDLLTMLAHAVRHLLEKDQARDGAAEDSEHLTALNSAIGTMPAAVEQPAEPMPGEENGHAEDNA